MMSDVRIDNYFIINDLTITQAFETRNVNHTATIFHYTSNRGKVNELFAILQVIFEKKLEFNTKTLSFDTIGQLYGQCVSA